MLVQMIRPLFLRIQIKSVRNYSLTICVTVNIFFFLFFFFSFANKNFRNNKIYQMKNGRVDILTFTQTLTTPYTVNTCSPLHTNRVQNSSKSKKYEISSSLRRTCACVSVCFGRIETLDVFCLTYPYWKNVCLPQ